MIYLVLNVLFLSCTNFGVDGKIEELDKEEVQKAYCKEKGIDFEKNKRYVCVQIPSMFKHIAALGSFASDRGCMEDGYYFAGEFTTLKKATPKALEYYGWSDKEKREKLALDWVKFVVLVWESPQVSLPNKKFPQKKFFEPKAWTEEGKVKVKLWVQEPVGMQNKADYYAVEYTFSEKGEIINVKDLSSETIWGD